MKIMQQYNRAAICKSGHVINDSFHSSQNLPDNYCEQCGQEIIYKCLGCETSLRGLTPPEVEYEVNFTVPLYCFNCSRPYPWTQETIQAIRDLADEAELSEEDKSSLVEASQAMSVEGPMAESGAIKFGKIVGKVSGKVGDALLQIGVKVAVEAVKNFLTGP